MCVVGMQAVETRELTAMLSSSCSSEETLTLREVDEELFDSSDLEEEASAGGVDAECEVSYQQQQARPRAPSRLARMCSGAVEMYTLDAKSPTAAAGAADERSGGQLAVVSKTGSSELGSLVSDRTMITLATAMSLGSKGNAVEADLLFDLEEDASSSGPHTPSSSIRMLSAKQHDEVMEGASPPAADGDSIRAVDVQQLQECLTGAQLLSAGMAAEPKPLAAGLSVTARLPPLPSNSLLSPATPAIARSVQMADGWMYRNLKAKPAAALAERCVLNSSKKATAGARRRTGLQCAMYPPPVVRAAPKSANEVLSGLSEDQWVAFMAELQSYMDEALHAATGSWRRASQAAGLVGAAMSCPRF